MISRKEFIGGALAAAAAGGCTGIPWGCGCDERNYSVAMLGDTHFDETEWGKYHVGWKPRDDRDAGGRRTEFARNKEMWKKRLPSLIAAASACSRPDDAFLLQLGDLVQGDCAGEDVYRRYFADAVAACSNGFGDIPFLTVAGNHDVRNGGRKPYEEFFNPLHSRSIGRTVDSTTFDFRKGPDAWIFVDFMKPDAERLFSALAAAGDARYVFVVSHSPVTPTDGWPFFWIPFKRPAETALRRRLRSELMRLNAIVLCGHTHLTEINEWRYGGGRMTQFTANSVWRDPAQAVPKLMTDDPAMWGKLWVEKNVTDAPMEHDGEYTTRTRAEALKFFREYAEGLARYEKYAAAGHYRLNVSDAGVSVDYYGGDSRTPTCNYVLR
jgi:3',5'-cyclic AMP phosphodiesterase CpdA